MALSSRELPKTVDQLRSLVDPSRPQQIDFMTGVLLAVDVAELAEELHRMVADLYVDLCRAGRDLEELRYKNMFPQAENKELQAENKELRARLDGTGS